MWGWVAAACVAAAPGQWASAVSGMEKVRPGRALAGSSESEWVLARGECGGAQIVVRSPLGAVEATASALRPSTAGTPLRAHLFREAFVPVATPSNAAGATGPWPDPLVPDEDAFLGERRNAFPASSTPERPLVVYAEVCVPQGQAPGAYRGDVTLRAPGEADLRIGLQVFVTEATLPATSSLPNTFGLSLYSMARGHHLDPASPSARTLLGFYMRSALTHRLSLYGLSMDPPRSRAPGDAPDFGAYDRELAPFLDGTALGSGARFTTIDLRQPRGLPADEAVDYVRAFRRHLVDRTWTPTLFFYAKDEPKPDDIPLVLSQAAAVHRAGSGVSVLVTSPFDERLIGNADILCPNLNCFFSRPGPQTCRRIEPVAELRRLMPNARIWWYQSCSSHGCGDRPAGAPYTGWPSYMIDHSLGLNRAMGALAFLSGVEGELYFDTVYAYGTGDPWNGAYAFGGNGDGTLFYPGTPARIGGTHDVPVESLRLVAIRQGLQDYEYLKQLEGLGDGAFARTAAHAVVHGGYAIEESAEAWERFHRALAERLDRDVRR